MPRRILLALTATAAVYGFAGWAYIAVIAVVHPQTLHLPLTHLLPYPREDTFGAACFLVSGLSFAVHLMLRGPARPAGRPGPGGSGGDPRHSAG
ncbi:MAG: hypothetical protein QOH97_4893 [Actinoplanes sp.]|jgi:hypothetical protein|nr:hypothetical protein [Actinoplanes sp.]